MIDENLVNLAEVIASELRAQMIPGKKLYRTGNMNRSVMVVAVDEETVDVVIATDYASYTDDRGRFSGWVEDAVDKAAKAYLSANNVENMSAFGIAYPEILK